MPKQDDRNCFDRWYRTSQSRIGLKPVLERKVRLAITIAEHHLGHPVCSVHDIGCGEGAWRAPLLALRPKLDYPSVDASEYAVARFGTSRNLKLAKFEHLGQLWSRPAVDLLVCSDVLHYLNTTKIKSGLAGFDAALAQEYITP